jgi:hypothetical protein
MLKKILSIISIFILLFLVVFFSQRFSSNKDTVDKSFVVQQDSKVDIDAELMNCDDFERQIVSLFPDLIFIQSTENIQPISLNQENNYCELVATHKGGGVNFISEIGTKVHTYFESNHWIYNMLMTADGATGGSFVYERGSDAAAVALAWINDAELCPAQNEPIVLCNAPQDKKIYEIRMQLYRNESQQ